MFKTHSRAHCIHTAATEWSTLANVAAVGDEHVDVLTASLDGWDVGDEIIISGTTFGGDASTHETRYISSIHENHGECSQFSVVPCQSYARVNFTDADGKPAPLNFTHVSKTHTSQSKQIDARAVVARLTRNVRVVGVESTSNRFGAAVAIHTRPTSRQGRGSFRGVAALLLYASGADGRDQPP